MHYVATNRDSWSQPDFYSVGRDLVADVLAWAGPRLRKDRMLEIGCGAGRMLTHFASTFDRVEGADIALEMLQLAREHVTGENVEFHEIAGAGLDNLPLDAYDFVFSFQVFQHIPDQSAVDAYLRDTARVLRRDGTAALQFDSRPNPLLRRLLMALPDTVLPRDKRRCIRRYPIPPADVREMVRSAGLELVDERSPGTGSHFVLLRRPA